jgi:hypothetical protein
MKEENQGKSGVIILAHVFANSALIPAPRLITNKLRHYAGL